MNDEEPGRIAVALDEIKGAAGQRQGSPAAREGRVTVPELALITGTRGMLGVGIGLLMADRLHYHRRYTVGRTLFLLGAGPPQHRRRRGGRLT